MTQLRAQNRVIGQAKETSIKSYCQQQACIINSMEQQLGSDNNPEPQGQQQLHTSAASSYIFEESMNGGALFNQQQQPQITINIHQVPAQQQPKSALTFDQKLQNLNFSNKSQVEGEQVFNQFLIKFRSKEQQLQQAIQSMLEQKNAMADITLTICMFYLTYISYYFMRNHETMLNQDFRHEQISLIKTNFSFAKHKKIIGINYQTLLQCNYPGKIRILEILKEILKERRIKHQNCLRIILGLVETYLLIAKGDDVPIALKHVGKEMRMGNMDAACSKIKFNELLQYFKKFVLCNNIKLRPNLNQYLKLFECDQDEP